MGRNQSSPQGCSGASPKQVPDLPDFEVIRRVSEGLNSDDPSLTRFEVAEFRVAKRRQPIAAGVSPQKKDRNNSSREAATAIISAAAASRLTCLFSYCFRGLTPTAMCCRRYAAEVCNFRTNASGYQWGISGDKWEVISNTFLASDDPFNNDPPGFCRTQRKPIASDKKLNGITERSATQMLNFLAVGQPHFHETNRDGILATDVEYAGFLTLIQ